MVNGAKRPCSCKPLNNEFGLRAAPRRQNMVLDSRFQVALRAVAIGGFGMIVSVTSVSAQANDEAPTKNAAAPKDEFARLESDMEEAHDAYLDLLREGGEAKKRAEASDPRVAVLAKMDSLADRAA